MKKVLYLMLVIFIIAAMGACSSGEESSDEVTPTEQELITYYDKNEAINIFLNNYNECNPNAKIEKGMFETYYHHGSEHDDQIILQQGEFEIILSDGIDFQVNITGKLAGIDDYKDCFIRFAKGYNKKITNEIAEGYWKQVLEDDIHCVEFDEFECYLQGMDDNIDYMTIEGALDK